MGHADSRHSVHHSGDIVFLEFLGEADQTDMERILAFIDTAMFGQPPACFVIADVRKISTITPEGRKAASKWQNRSRLRGVAVIGASPLIRGLIQLIGNALSLFSKRPVPLRFFANQSDAVAWIADCRRTGRPAGP